MNIAKMISPMGSDFQNLPIDSNLVTPNPDMQELFSLQDNVFEGSSTPPQLDKQNHGYNVNNIEAAIHIQSNSDSK
jgi:hypothetical protein